MIKTESYHVASEFAAHMSHSLHSDAQAMEVSFAGSQFCSLHFLKDVKFTLVSHLDTFIEFVSSCKK